MIFTPTKQQVETAQKLFIAMAYRDMAKAAFEKMKDDILQKDAYHFDKVYFSEQWKNKGRSFTLDRIIRNTKDICYMAGMRLYNTPSFNGTDADRFYSVLRNYAAAAGFIHAENAEHIAENEVSRLKNRFIFLTKPLHGFMSDEIILLKHHENIIRLLLHGFDPLIKDNLFEANKRRYFSERFRDNRPAQDSSQ